LASEFARPYAMRLQFVRVAMVERIVSELSDKAYETTLVIYAACCFGSLLLAATI
jgi:hypothetical protein